MPRNRQGTQPVRVPTGGPQGQRQQLETAQQVIPLPDRQSGGVSPVGPGPNGGVPVERPDVFGPTSRPGEPLTAGAPAGPGSNGIGMLPDDVDGFLPAIEMQYPSPGLRRLREFSASRTRDAPPVS